MEQTNDSAVSEARAAQAEAIAHLATMRHEYHAIHGAAYQSAKDAHRALLAKVHDADAEMNDAQADFESAFEAAGFETNDATRAALNRKNDAHCIRESLDKAMKSRGDAMFELAAAASHAGRNYIWAYRRAYAAWARAEAEAAMAEHGPAIARAMRLLANVPRADSAYEDSQGRPSWSYSQDKELRASRWDGILKYLESCALDGGHDENPPPEIGELDAMEQHFLTPAQINRRRKELAVAANK